MRSPPAASPGLRRALTLLLLGAAACGAPRPSGVARSWETGGAVFTAAAWGMPDTATLGRALERAFAAAQGLDSAEIRAALAAAREAVTRGWGGARPAWLDDAWRRAVARGLALDRAAQALAGVADSAVLDFAGQYQFLRGGGRRVGIPDPHNAFRSLATLTLPGEPAVLAVRTAIPDPERAPRGGGGAGALSATAVGTSARDAAAWADAFLHMGCERALRAVAAGTAGSVAVICVDQGGAVRWSAGLAGHVVSGAASPPDSVSAPGPGRAPAPGRAGAPSDSSRRS